MGTGPGTSVQNRSKNGEVVQKRAIGSTVIFFDGFYTVEKLRVRRMQLNACHKKLLTFFRNPFPVLDPISEYAM